MAKDIKPTPQDEQPWVKETSPDDVWLVGPQGQVVEGYSTALDVLNHLQAQLQQAREALDGVPLLARARTPSDDAGYWECPGCWNREGDPHEGDCYVAKVTAALSQLAPQEEK